MQIRGIPATLAVGILLAPVAAGTALAQAPAGTDIYLVPIPAVLESLDVQATRNVTARAGYDNQPCFTPDGAALLYTSIRADGQADIYRLDVATGRTERVTSTPESEFSPTPLPEGDGFSVVRVEADSTQRLWRFDAGGTAAGPILETVRGVGYHAWADPRTLALFILGEPHALHAALLDEGTSRPIAQDIGRSIQRIPGRSTISYLQNEEGGKRSIREIDLRSGTTRLLAPVLEGSEDFAWTPDGRLLMAQGLVLAVWNPGGEGAWQTVGAFAGHVSGRITRLAVSPDGRRLALVADEAPPR